MIVPPFLAHLQTDRRGIPVPYVNRWGKTEKPENVAVQFDPHIQQRAVFYFDTDESEPDFTAQNMQRQRECMVTGLCQVCGRQIPWSRRFLVVSTMSTRQITSPGPRRGSTVVSEPWMDRRCADFAIEKCPALIRRSHGEDLTLLPVTDRQDVDMMVSTGWIEGPLEAETRAWPVAMWAELLVHAQPLLGLPTAASRGPGSRKIAGGMQSKLQPTCVSVRTNV